MAKPNRGSNIRHLWNRGRGTCPVCGRTGVKLLYPRIQDGAEIKVCKRCRPAKSL